MLDLYTIYIKVKVISQNFAVKNVAEVVGETSNEGF